MCIETTNNVLILFAGVSSLSTAVIAYLAYINYKLSNEIKILQIKIASHMIYYSTKHGAHYSQNDYDVIYNRLLNS